MSDSEKKEVTQDEWEAIFRNTVVVVKRDNNARPGWFGGKIGMTRAEEKAVQELTGKSKRGGRRKGRKPWKQELAESPLAKMAATAFAEGRKVTETEMADKFNTIMEDIEMQRRRKWGRSSKRKKKG
jgi:hypothetical protein